VVSEQQQQQQQQQQQPWCVDRSKAHALPHLHQWPHTLSTGARSLQWRMCGRSATRASRPL